MPRGFSLLVLLTLTLAFILLVPASALARPAFSEQTGQPCALCHEEGALRLTPFGEAFRATGFRWPGGDEPPQLSPLARAWETALRFLHIVAAVSWLGAIIFIHVIMTPKSIETGIPTAAFRLAWVNILALAVTGTLLTTRRLGSFTDFFDTRFGRLLGIKIIFFLALVLSAAFVTLRLNRLLKKAGQTSAGLNMLPPEKMREFTASELSYYDGREGRPAYVAYGGRVYDVSESKLWRQGSHARRHQAGADLTGSLAEAPHGAGVFARIKVAGILKEEGKDAVQPHCGRRAVLLLHILAYVNLGLALAVLFILALWKV